MKKPILALLLLVITQASSLYAGIAVDLLDHSSGVRALSMGGAHTALVDSVESPAYNPAGLALLTKPAINSSSFQYFGGEVNRLSVDTGYPIYNGVAGFNYIQEGVSDIPYTRDNGQNQPEIYGSFNYSQRVLNFAYAKEISAKRIYVGANIKYLTTDLATSNASGIGIDCGIIYKLSNQINAGLSIKNIMPVQVTWKNGMTDEIPLKVVGGVGYHALLFDRPLTMGLDLDLINKNRTARLAYGAELVIWQKSNSVIVLRAGKNQLDKLTMGIGLEYQQYKLDFALLDHELGSSTLISLGVLI